jgi:cytochrome c553
MKRALLGMMMTAVALAACQRESGAPVARDDASRPTRESTRSMGAASAPASSAARAPATPPQLVPATTAAPPTNEDVSAGRTIATQGAPGAAACVGCHGANGEGNAQAGFPRLAALGRIYIEHQLNSYADGTRANPVMTPIAGALSAQQRTQVAAYFAGLGSAPAANASTGNAGNTGSPNAPVLVVRGDDKRNIQACANCHGPQGIGDAAANPYLAGQSEQYLTNALAEWKSGARHNDPSGQMPAIAKALSDADVKTIVSYYASMPPPAPRNAQAAAMAVNTSRPAVQSGPVSATAPTQGTGTQQGAPLTGGSQGPGSGGAATNPQQTGNK